MKKAGILFVVFLLMAGAASAITDADTFHYTDTFEDGDISEYSGDTGSFSTVSSPSYLGSNALEKAQSSRVKIYNSNVEVEQGQTISGYIRTDGGANSVSVDFGGTSSGFYRAIVSTNYGDIRLTKASGTEDYDTVLSSTSASISSGNWYRYEIHWQEDGTILFQLYDESTGEFVAQTSVTDNSYQNGGLGYWGHGAANTYWDSSPANGEHYVPNGDLEVSNTYGWNIGSGQIVSGSAAYSGDEYWEQNDLSSYTNIITFGYGDGSTPSIGRLQGGETYKMVFYAQSDSSIEQAVTIRGSQRYDKWYIPSQSTDSSWNRYTGTFTMPDNPSDFQRFEVDFDGGDTGNLLFDRVSLYKVSGTEDPVENPYDDAQWYDSHESEGSGTTYTQPMWDGLSLHRWASSSNGAIINQKTTTSDVVQFDTDLYLGESGGADGVTFTVWGDNSYGDNSYAGNINGLANGWTVDFDDYEDEINLVNPSGTTVDTVSMTESSGWHDAQITLDRRQANRKVDISFSGNSYTLNMDSSEATGQYIGIGAWSGGVSDSYKVRNVKVNGPLTADFEYSPDNPEPGEQITFTSTSTHPDGSILGTEWDTNDDNLFGDGNTQTYDTPGTYYPSVRVQDSTGEDTYTEPVTVAYETEGITSVDWNGLYRDGQYWLDTADFITTVEAQDNDGISEASLIEQIDGGSNNLVQDYSYSSGTYQISQTYDDVTSGTNDYFWRINDDGNNDIYTTNTVTVTVDTQAPTIDSLTAPSGQIDTTSPTFEIDASDNEAIYQTRLLIDGTVVATSDTGYLLTQPEVSQGQHDWTVEVEDNAGNTATDSGSFTVDTEAPTLDYQNIAEGDGPYNEEQLTFNTGWTDSTSGVSELTLYINGNAEAPVTDSDTASLTANVPEGDNTYYWEATDGAGNTATSPQQTFTVDRTGPSFDAAAQTDVENVTLIAENFSESVQQVTFDPEGKDPVTIDQSQLYYEETFTYDQDENYEANITATDDAGNTNTVTVTFEINTQGPTIQSFTAQQIFYSGDGSKAETSWNVFDETEVQSLTFSLNGEGSYVPNTPVQDDISGTFEFGQQALPYLQEGSNTLTLEATDGTYTTTESVTFNMDQTAPNLDSYDAEIATRQGDRAAWNDTYQIDVNTTGSASTVRVMVVADERLTEFVELTESGEDQFSGTLDPTNYFSEDYLKSRDGPITLNINMGDQYGNNRSRTNLETPLIRDNSVSFYDWESTSPVGENRLRLAFKTDENLTQVSTEIYNFINNPTLNFQYDGDISQCNFIGGGDCLYTYQNDYNVTIENPIAYDVVLYYRGQRKMVIPAEDREWFWIESGNNDDTNEALNYSDDRVLETEGTISVDNFESRFTTAELFGDFEKQDWNITEDDGTYQYEVATDVPAPGVYNIRLNLTDTLGNNLQTEKSARVRPSTLTGNFYQTFVNLGISDFYVGLFLLFVFPVWALVLELKSLGSTIFTKGFTIAWPVAGVVFGLFPPQVNIVALFTAGAVVGLIYRSFAGGSA